MPGDLPLDDVWAQEVAAFVDPVFALADVGFGRLPSNTRADALLWEADPVRFAERYPESQVERSYGEDWPPHCIDFWVYVDPVPRRARISVEGWRMPELHLDLHGHAERDGEQLRAFFARVLAVDLRDLDDLPD